MPADLRPRCDRPSSRLRSGRYVPSTSSTSAPVSPPNTPLAGITERAYEPRHAPTQRRLPVPCPATQHRAIRQEASKKARPWLEPQLRRTQPLLSGSSRRLYRLQVKHLLGSSPALPCNWNLLAGFCFCCCQSMHCPLVQHGLLGHCLDQALSTLSFSFKNPGHANWWPHCLVGLDMQWCFIWRSYELVHGRALGINKSCSLHQSAHTGALSYMRASLPTHAENIPDS